MYIYINKMVACIVCITLSMSHFYAEHTCVCEYMYVYVCIYVYVYACMYIYVHKYINNIEQYA